MRSLINMSDAMQIKKNELEVILSRFFSIFDLHSTSKKSERGMNLVHQNI